MDNEGRSCVYGLRHQARCLTAVIADSESEQNKFLVGTQSLKQEFEIASTIYRHVEEVWDISACPLKIDSSNTKAKLWRMGNSNLSVEGQDTKFQSPRTPVAPHLPLESVIELKVDANIKKILWDPTKELNRIVSIHDSSFKNENSLSLTTGTWNPNRPEIAIGKGCAIQGWDLKSHRREIYIIILIIFENSHSVLVRALDFNPNKPHQFASAGDDCKVRFWDLRNTSESIKEISDHTHWVWAIAYNRFHDQLFLSSGSDCQVNLQSIVSISSAAFHYNDDKSDDEYQDIPASPTDGLVRTYDQHEDSVYSVAWSASDPWIFCSLSYDGRAVINKVPSEEKYKIIL
ncbi:10706_t:CDS:2 [Diversispora eburnea]|uniref:10706_t:CDS:1 n=1 Tax=Diversispora eburnea TaxID=1213867 RepID=A0A9N8UVB9_9GLOM|nr:10706_t:CDS:2 [Diversispora eburnea]